MNNYTFKQYGKEYKRISKAAVWKAYNAGKEILLYPCKANPESTFNCGVSLMKSRREQFVIDEIGLKKDFISFCNSFIYYNCQYAELGKYPAFYCEM